MMTYLCPTKSGDFFSFQISMFLVIAAMPIKIYIAEENIATTKLIAMSFQ